MTQFDTDELLILGRKLLKASKGVKQENLTTKEWYTKYRGVDWDLIAKHRQMAR